MIKDSGSRYRPGERGSLKLRTRMSAEGIIGAVTGAVHAPRSLLFGRLDPAGRLRLIARSTPLSRPAAAELGAVLHPAGPEHPWYGRRFSAGWGTSEPLSSIRSYLTSSPRSTPIPLWIWVPTGTPCATCDFVTT